MLICYICKFCSVIVYLFSNECSSMLHVHLHLMFLIISVRYCVTLFYHLTFSCIIVKKSFMHQGRLIQSDENLEIRNEFY